MAHYELLFPTIFKQTNAARPMGRRIRYLGSRVQSRGHVVQGLEFRTKERFNATIWSRTLTEYTNTCSSLYRILHVDHRLGLLRDLEFGS